MKQNIYDNKIFYESYKALRETDNNCNILLEQPAMMRLLPDVRGKDVIDLGCGFGENCREFIRLGAKSVVGTDISHRMLEEAVRKNSCAGIRYIEAPLEELELIDGSYDIAYSSLCFHYIKDFDKLIFDISQKLRPDGVLLFSQEHPIETACSGTAGDYAKLENGATAYLTCDYADEKTARSDFWFVDGVIKYHRTVSTIINTLISNGFVIEAADEPVPDAQAISKRPGLEKALIRPYYLLIRAKRTHL